MDLRHLRYFLAVAEEGHFGRAAERLHIVQPALSMQIRALEEEFGGPLFVRTSRKVELTEAGRLLVIEAQRTITQAERAKATVQRSLRGEIGSVRIGFAGNAVFTGKLMEDLRAFHLTYPDAELVLREMVPNQQMDAVLSGQLDVGYVPSMRRVFDPQIKAEQVGSWPLVVAMSVDHPLAGRKRLSLKSIADQPLILYASAEDEALPIETLKQLIGREPHIAHRVSNTLSVLALAGAGLGIALVPEPLTQVKVPNIVYKRIIAAGMTADLMLISRRNETAGAVLAFVELARKGRRTPMTRPAD